MWDWFSTLQFCLKEHVEEWHHIISLNSSLFTCVYVCEVKARMTVLIIFLFFIFCWYFHNHSSKITGISYANESFGNFQHVSYNNCIQFCVNFLSSERSFHKFCQSLHPFCLILFECSMNFNAVSLFNRNNWLLSSQATVTIDNQSVDPLLYIVVLAWHFEIMI